MRILKLAGMVVGGFFAFIFVVAIIAAVAGPTDPDERKETAAAEAGDTEPDSSKADAAPLPEDRVLVDAIMRQPRARVLERLGPPSKEDDGYDTWNLVGDADVSVLVNYHDGRAWQISVSTPGAADRVDEITEWVFLDEENEDLDVKSIGDAVTIEHKPTGRIVREEASREVVRQEIQDRRDYAARLDELLLEQGIESRTDAPGKEAHVLRIRSPLFGRVMLLYLLEGGRISMALLGFERVRCIDGFGGGASEEL